MTSPGNSGAERNDTVNKKQTEELAELQTKWNMDCNQAVENTVAYILKRSKEDYLKVIGSETGLPSYQSDVLANVGGIGTHEEVAMLERVKLAQAVVSSFASVPENTIVGMLGKELVADLLLPQDLFEIEYVDEDGDAVDGYEIISNPADPAYITPAALLRHAA